jgi:ribonucleoside-diphosphate reductase subunit M2
MSTEFETPSKPLASGLSSIDITKESKSSSAALNAKLQASAVTAGDDKSTKLAEPVDEKAAAAEAEALEESRTQFVGEVDLPESEEPLLKESKSRFVLFPIKYREVSRPVMVN